MAKRGSSSGRWLQRQNTDHFVKQRDQEGYRSRAAFKLRELCEKDQLIQRGTRVLDLGAAPGGWTQVAAQRVGPRGLVVATDILPMEPVEGAHFILGDCRDDAVRASIAELVPPATLDLVMSDMAPNITGIAAADEAGMVELAEMTLDFAQAFLRPGGSLLIKLFQFADTEKFTRDLKGRFGTVARRKPQASRAESREFYVVAKRYGI